jgi:hypothetical protein
MVYRTLPASRPSRTLLRTFSPPMSTVTRPAATTMSCKALYFEGTHSTASAATKNRLVQCRQPGAFRIGLCTSAFPDFSGWPASQLMEGARVSKSGEPERIRAEVACNHTARFHKGIMCSCVFRCKHRNVGLVTAQGHMMQPDSSGCCVPKCRTHLPQPLSRERQIFTRHIAQVPGIWPVLGTRSSGAGAGVSGSVSPHFDRHRGLDAPMTFCH